MPTELKVFTDELKKYTGTTYVSTLDKLVESCRNNQDHVPTDTVCYEIRGTCSTNNNCYYKKDAPAPFDISVVYPLSGHSTNDVSNVIGVANRLVTWGNLKALQLSESYRSTSAVDDEHIKQIMQDIHDLSGSLQRAQHAGTYSDTINIQRENRIKRDALDRKMQSLYEQESDVTMRYDNSVYTTLIWTVMTTSILYYLFIKL